MGKMFTSHFCYAFYVRCVCHRNQMCRGVILPWKRVLPEGMVVGNHRMSRRCAAAIQPGLGARCALCVCSSTSFIFKATYRVSHEFHLPKWTLKNKKRNWWVESKGYVNKKMNLKRPTMKRRRDSSECCSISYWILEFYRIFQWIEREARWNGTEEERGSIGIQHQKYAKLV